MPDFNDPLPAPKDADGRAFTGGSDSPDGAVEFYYQNNGPIAPDVGKNSAPTDHDGFANPYRVGG